VKKGLEIDFDTADRITVITLKEQRKYLKKELADFKKGKWLHPEDVVNNTRMIQNLDHVIKYFGG
jgi:hypothetical protein